jgi:hypothetical protein
LFFVTAYGSTMTGCLSSWLTVGPVLFFLVECDD